MKILMQEVILVRLPLDRFNFLDFENKWPYYLLAYIGAGILIDNFFSATLWGLAFLLFVFLSSISLVFIFQMAVNFLQIFLLLITFGKFDSNSLDSFNDEIERNGHYLAIPLSLFFLYILRDFLLTFFDF